MKKARALVDIIGTDIKCGDFFEADDETMIERVTAGEADPLAEEVHVYGDAEIPPAKKHPGRPKAETVDEPAPEKAKSKK